MMMRLLRLLFIILFAFSLQAQNNLRVFTSNGERIRLYCADSLVNSDFQANVLLAGVKKDTLHVLIELDSKQKIPATVYFLDKSKPVKNKEFNYLLENKAGKAKLIFAGVKDVVVLPNPLVPLKPVVDTSYKYRNNVLAHYCELKDGKASYYNNIKKGTACISPMPADYINYMNVLMKKTSLQDEKFRIAENTIRNNCISTNQLAKILVHIDYELDKLKLTKEAYFHVTDKDSLTTISGSLKLESAKNELKNFLKTAPQNAQETDKGCATASPQDSIAVFTKTLGNCSNDSERYALFKARYMEYCYSVPQVKLVLSQFIHDREKLDVARALYFNTTNKQNFIDVSDLFSYTTSVAEIKAFLDRQN